jgi:hypothetical protein
MHSYVSFQAFVRLFTDLTGIRTSLSRHSYFSLQTLQAFVGFFTELTGFRKSPATSAATSAATLV